MCVGASCERALLFVASTKETIEAEARRKREEERKKEKEKKELRFIINKRRIERENIRESVWYLERERERERENSQTGTTKFIK